MGKPIALQNESDSRFPSIPRPQAGNRGDTGAPRLAGTHGGLPARERGLPLRPAGLGPRRPKI